jgi:hypothetical protein
MEQGIGEFPSALSDLIVRLFMSKRKSNQRKISSKSIQTSVAGPFAHPNLHKIRKMSDIVVSARRVREAEDPAGGIFSWPSCRFIKVITG